MDCKSVNHFFNKIGDLKHLNREGWVIRNIVNPESVAGHQYRMAIMAMVLFEGEEGIDVNKVIKLALIHDIPECIVGDITPYDNVSQEAKHQQEMDAMKTLSQMLPIDIGERLVKMFEEYEERESLESKLTKQLDVYDAVMQAFEYEKQNAEKNNRLNLDMDHFFLQEYLKKIEHPKIKSLLDQLLDERSLFLSKIKNDETMFVKI